MTHILSLTQKHWLALSLALSTAIVVTSLWPVETLPQVPGSDKTHHFIAYALLILPVAVARPSYQFRFALLFFCFSAGIELIQPYVNRYGEWLDLLANGGGILCGLIAGTWLRQLVTRLSSTDRE